MVQAALGFIKEESMQGLSLPGELPAVALLPVRVLVQADTKNKTRATAIR